VHAEVDRKALLAKVDAPPGACHAVVIASEYDARLASM